ncbi:hypothetical protein C8Q76DRAFT_799516 [Earliella scabrosa]|nr:hypothetical protein C8Q76DRAFT_799516 [Earliella scabrosa]
MAALLIGTLLVTLAALASCDTPPNVVIDDADPRIQYTGTWIRNPDADPMKLNYDGTLSLSNTPHSNATLTFEGAIQVAVVGSFPLIGTHAMKSQYTIDGTNLTQYWPPNTVVRPIHQQRFFLSEMLSTDKHTLVITNAGEAFYLDYIRLYFPQSSSSLQPSSTPAPSHTPSTSPSQKAPTAQAPSTEDTLAPPPASATLARTPPSDSAPLAAQPSLYPTSDTLVIATFVAFAVCDDPTIMVDDTDGRIQYSSSWLRNTIPDPTEKNYGGTSSFTNISQSTATLAFEGVLQLSVWGAFPVVGAFKMASQYSIDGSNTTTFTPLSTVSQPGYRQRFFLSPFFSPDKHTLTITNLGENFYLDYILLHVVPSAPGMTFIPGPIPLPPVQDSSPALASDQSTSRESDSSSTSLPHTTSDTTLPQSTPTETQQSRTSSTSPPFTSSDHDPDTSSFLSETRIESSPAQTSLALSSMSSSTSSIASVAPIIAEEQRSGGLTTGAYIAVAVGGAAVLLCLLVGLWLWYRWRQRQTNMSQTQKKITPFDSGLTSLAEDSKGIMISGGIEYNNSTSTLIHGSAPPYEAAVDLRSEESRGRRVTLGGGYVSGIDRALHEMGEHTATPTAETVGYNSLPFSNGSPLVLSERDSTGIQHGYHDGGSSPLIASPAQASKQRGIPFGAPEYTPTVDAPRRRSVDGGVRIAGGPARRGGVDLDAFEVRSAASTLPPLYEQYSSS